MVERTWLGLLCALLFAPLRDVLLDARTRLGLRCALFLFISPLVLFLFTAWLCLTRLLLHSSFPFPLHFLWLSVVALATSRGIGGGGFLTVQIAGLETF